MKRVRRSKENGNIAKQIKRQMITKIKNSKKIYKRSENKKINQ